MRSVPLLPIVLAALLGLLPAHGAADCALMHPVAVLLTPITASVPTASGALVAGFRFEGGEGPLRFDGIRLTRRRSTTALQAIEIAPGLVRLVPASTVRPGTYALEGLGASTDVTIGRAPMPGVPVRPAVSEVRRVATATRRGLLIELRGTLGFPIPPGIVAIVGYWGTSTTPSAWAPAVVGTTEAVLFRSGGDCETPPERYTAPPAEGSLDVRIAYVDQFGQVSPVSDPVAVE